MFFVCLLLVFCGFWVVVVFLGFSFVSVLFVCSFLFYKSFFFYLLRVLTGITIAKRPLRLGSRTDRECHEKERNDLLDDFTHFTIGYKGLEYSEQLM